MLVEQQKLQQKSHSNFFQYLEEVYDLWQDEQPTQTAVRLDYYLSLTSS